MPTTLQWDAGPRIDPPVHEPKVPIASPAAVAAPDPELEPPGIYSVFQGFRASGKPLLGSGPPSANSCIASLPKSIVPASANLAVVVASTVGTRLASTFELPVVRTPLVS